MKKIVSGIPFIIITLVAFLTSFPAVSDTSPVEDVATVQSQAEQGDSVAQYNMGVMNYEGKDMPKNDVEAGKWFRKSAEQGYAPAQYNLAIMYYNGKGVSKDEAEALKLLHNAADQGLPDAIKLLRKPPQQSNGMPFGGPIGIICFFAFLAWLGKRKKKGEIQLKKGEIRLGGYWWKKPR